MKSKANFKIIEQKFVQEYSSEITLFEHIKSGAKVLFVENDDTNKVFSVSFRTPVSDSTGVPHILEHSVLNGSQKYPVKEPFVNLIKSSLNTFLNAMTYPDRTIYPVASQNKKDLYNLARVYMDAVFFPNLSEETFKQEGWHYELEAKDGELTRKGVVFNEMKGVYSNPDSTYTDHIMNNLCPDNTYQHDSGGNPEIIPTLTYDKFKQFHDSFYHPSNSLVYIYGDDKSDDRFDLVEEYLSRFEKINVDSAINTQSMLTKIEDKVAYFDPGEDADSGGSVATSWLLPVKTKTMPYSILDKILNGSPTSPMYKALVESGLGKDTAPFFGIELDLLQPMVSYGLKGVKTENQDQVVSLISDTLTSIVKKGIDSKDIEAAINSTEFQLREYDTGKYPKGLALMLDIVVDWVYDRDFMSTLNFENEISDLRKELVSNPRLFENIIQHELLENNHQFNFKYLPKSGFFDEIESQEKLVLAEYKESLSDEDLLLLVEQTKSLKEFQDLKDTPEQLATLSRLSYDDLIGEPEKIPSELKKIDGIETYYHSTHTNGIGYIDIGFDLHNLEAKYFPYLSLYSRLLTELDTISHSVLEVNQLLDLHTGNYDAEIVNMESISGQEVRYLFLRGKVLPQNVHYLTDIWLEVLQTLQLDNKEKIRQIFIDIKSTLSSNMISDGRLVGLSAISSTLTKTGVFDEITGGYRYFEWLGEIVKKIDTDWAGVFSDLVHIQTNLFTKSGLIINVTSESKDYELLNDSLAVLVTNLKQGKKVESLVSIDQYSKKTAFVIPTKVNYVSYGVNLKNALGGEISGAFNVVLNLLNYEYLWPKVRAQGGAYGSRAGLDKTNGLFSIWSYRDPRFEGTIEDYKNIGEYLLNLKLDKEKLLTSIIGSVGKFDNYLTAPQKGWASLIDTLREVKYEKRVQIRQEILDVSEADFHKLGNVLITAFDSGIFAVVSSQTSLDEVSNKAEYDVIKAL
jgi:presequence protease